MLQIDCPPTRKVELCATADITQTGVGLGNSAGTFNVPWTLQVCGARACLSDVDISQPSVWVPSIKQECCYDLSAIALMVQNLNSLSVAFSNGGQAVECRSITTTGNESLPVAINLDSDTTFLAFGTVRVCVDNALSGDSVTVKPLIGCESSQASCIAGVFEIPDEGRTASIATIGRTASELHEPLELCAVIQDFNVGNDWTVQTSVKAICF